MKEDGKYTNSEMKMNLNGKGENVEVGVGPWINLSNF